MVERRLNIWKKKQKKLYDSKKRLKEDNYSHVQDGKKGFCWNVSKENIRRMKYLKNFEINYLGSALLHLGTVGYRYRY